MVEIIENGKGKTVLAKTFMPEGTVLCTFDLSQTYPDPDRYSIQISIDKHIQVDTIWSLINHGCAPNVLVDTEHGRFVVSMDIQPGEELLWFYPSTEWEMKSPFDCRCNHEQCLRRISGAKYIPRPMLSKYFINKHIEVQLNLQISIQFEGDASDVQ
jgi:hypothetical protein